MDVLRGTDESVEVELNKVRHIILRIGTVLIAVCRAVYCLMFFIMSFILFDAVRSNIGALLRSHPLRWAVVLTYIVMISYSAVFAVAGWKVFRGKHTLKRWAVAANLILILTYVPAIVLGDWRAVLRSELGWWPMILVGVFGILIFSLPYREELRKSVGQVIQHGQGHGANL
jgi:hypothetical protein